MRYYYEPEHTCSQQISFELEDNIVSNIEFIGGCNGNLKAIAKLLDGATADELINKLSGITCGRRPTSCGNQLAKAVQEYAKNSTTSID